MSSLSHRSGDAILPPLSQAVGYVVVVGIGLAFALGMMAVTRILKRTVGEDNSKIETFMVADRRVSTGLVASAVVSSWLWSTALLSTVMVGYTYGVSGPFWYGAGCAPMIVCFGYMGKVAHLSFMFLAVINNLFNTCNMILGASSAISSLTGMHIMASTFLLPLGVVIYTLVGGIKATFLTDYTHTVIILILCCYLTTKTITSDEIGSISNLFDLVNVAQSDHQIDGNFQGSLLTMTSEQGIIFAIILLVSNFGAVIMDTGYFVKAFAASPSAVLPGYVIGGISYFGIPWALGTVMGTAALALESSPSFPTYPRAMTSSEVTNGLALPYAAIAVAGKGGAVAVLLITFMAVTSTLSAQIIAVSSIVAFDGYRTYWNHNASNDEVILWSRIGVVIFGAFSAGFTAILHYAGVDMGWTLYMIGVVTCPGIIPLICTIIWNRQSKVAAITSAYLGMATGLAVWLSTAYRFYGEVSVASTGGALPCMYGTVASALSPLLYTVVITLFRPENFDWSKLQEESLNATMALADETRTTHDAAISAGVEGEDAGIEKEKSYQRSKAYALFWAIATFLGIWVLWPLPMYAANYVFSKTFFTAWVAVSLIWLWITFVVISVYPVWDGRHQITEVMVGLLRGMRR
ncbi:hypothetical protein ASPVEDRAFT_53289 [Aspergillus versicolor CBS 583.65]|uniref:Urea active transporter n=1 Tax=Aspergillus versicolor CBS 583.65 TaxID=1036611 RepID=A0A1L9PMD4_ASPVE|nr:uncharacterized protein ASPVEDRAFT_53289 [Aspergillus versicolor CBS 583.65]OJJ02653.1 hypothetical protein ASPVEDRAFT_53289 [Aspergillus versicolor CBS 583.65]